MTPYYGSVLFVFFIVLGTTMANMYTDQIGEGRGARFGLKKVGKITRVSGLPKEREERFG